MYHKYHPLKCKTLNKPNRNRLRNTRNKLMVAIWEGFVGMGEKGRGIRKYKFVVTK